MCCIIFRYILIAGLLTGFLIGLLAQELIVRLRFLTEKKISRVEHLFA